MTPLARMRFIAAALCCAWLAGPAPLHAQSAGVQGNAGPAANPKIKTRNPTGSPLDTLLNTKLWADVPEAKDFVRESRPPADTLDYQPTTGTDPDRPKPRTKAELDALRKELEGAARRNEALGGQPAKAH